MVQDSGIMHLLTKRRNMSTETVKALKEIFEILKLSKQYVDILEKRVAILEKASTGEIKCQCQKEFYKI
jgi:hypothetical protein